MSSTNSINLYDFLSYKKIIHSDEVANYIEGIQFFAERENNPDDVTDIITYNSCRKFRINNTGVLEVDEKGQSFYEFSLNRENDIVNEFYFESSRNMKCYMTFYLNDVLYTLLK